MRETKEETGDRLRDHGLVGIYTNPRHVILYTSDGEVRQECSVVFAARPVGGEPTPSSESSEVRWVPAGDVDEFTMHPSMRQRVAHYLEGRERRTLGDGAAAGRNEFAARRVAVWTWPPGRDVRRSAGCRRSGVGGRTR